MKLILPIFALLLLMSCSSTEKIIEDVTSGLNLPDRIATGRAKSYAYSVGGADSTLSQIDYQYYTPQFSSGVMDSTFKDSVNARIIELAAWELQEDIVPPLGPLTDYYFERIVDEFTIDEIDDPDSLKMHHWSMEISFDISETDEYVVLETGSWSYTGGAHGNGAVIYDYFDKSTGKMMDYSHFFTSLEALSAAAEPFFREQQKVPEDTSLEDFGFWFENDQFAVSENFYFSGENIIFVFNPYDIAPYAAGTITLTVPLSALEGILK